MIEYGSDLLKNTLHEAFVMTAEFGAIKNNRKLSLIVPVLKPGKRTRSDQQL
jgi:hypothetical protein